MLLANKHLFEENGYDIQMTEDRLILTKFGFETEYFEVKRVHDRYYVSVPLKNSIYQYKTSFVDYDMALSYLETKLRDYIV